jgi:hypothetical protein
MLKNMDFKWKKKLSHVSGIILVIFQTPLSFFLFFLCENGLLIIEIHWDFMKMDESVLVSFPSLWQNTWAREPKRRKGLIWFKISKVSIHQHVELLLWFWEAHFFLVNYMVEETRYPYGH